MPTIIKCIIFLLIAISTSACNQEELWDESNCYPYLFKIELIMDNSQEDITQQNIYITYYNKDFSIADYKPEDVLSDIYESPKVANYGAYYIYKSPKKVKICFGHVDLYRRENMATQIELHVGEKVYTISAQYSINTNSEYTYLDGVLINDYFVSIKY